MADCYHQNGNEEKAVMWYESICTMKPENEHTNFSLMKLYDSLGYGLLVDHQYVKYKKALEDLGIEVNPHIKEWLDKRKSKKGIY